MACTLARFEPIKHLQKALKAKLRALHPKFITLGKSRSDMAKMKEWI
jgi:hypothetical protein